MSDPLVRFSVAIGGDLLEKFDRYREEHRYPNRSEAVRGLMRAALIQDVVNRDEAETVGVLTLVYDHHKAGISDRLNDLQHLHFERVLTTTHVHLDHDRCLEVILLRGPVRLVRELADGLIGTKGVETGRLVLAPASPIGEAGHDHGHGHGHEHGHDHPHRHGHHHGPGSGPAGGGGP